jgi:hypothetical protein
VRGRLDGLTVRTLFELVIAARPSARVSVRDASFLYEVELRGGGIHRASRTSGDGTFLRGDRVIPAMLGVGAGRFVVSSMKSPAGEEPKTLLADQFAKPIAQARSALHATTGARMMTVSKLVLGEEDVGGYLLATPEPARDLVRQLARGVSPREILLHGDVAPALMEDVLADLATRGAVVAVYRADGSDAMRGEAFDVHSILPDAEGTRASLIAPPIPFSPPKPADAALEASAREEKAEKKEPLLGESLEAAVMDAMREDSTALSPPARPAKSPTPPPGASAKETPGPGGAKEMSIPVTVEPTADLRPRPAGESGPIATRPRPVPQESTSDEPGFPRGLAIALAVLALLVIGLGTRSYLAQHAEPEETVRTLGVPQPDMAGVTYESIPAGVSVPPGQGLLTVKLAEGAVARIDGAEAPHAVKGVPLRMPLGPGVHLVAVGPHSRIVEVRVGRATVVNLEEP